MNCDNFREVISDMLGDGVDPASRPELADHLEACPACARYLSELKLTYIMVRPPEYIKASPGFKESTMKRLSEEPAPRAAARRRFESKYWKIAIAAVCLCGLTLVAPLNRLFKPEATAYALADTIKANLGLRSIHIKMDAPIGTLTEMWLECDEAGNATHLRTNYPITEDGAKDVVFQKDKANVWFRDKKCMATVREHDTLARLAADMQQFNPRFVMETIGKGRDAGSISVEMVEPPSQTEPILLKVTYKNRPGTLVEYTVDRESKLITQRDEYGTSGGTRELMRRVNYLEYNKPIDPAVFELNPPADVIRVDETKQVIGIAKDDLTTSEITKKVAREFFEALIAEDYDKAGQLYGGMPGAFMKKRLAETGYKFVRIESIGEPYPHPDAGTEGIMVPCKVELELKGEKKVEEFTPGIRPVYSQRDRWALFGGF